MLGSEPSQNPMDAPTRSSTPASQRRGRKRNRPNNKKRCRSRTCVEDDSFHGNNFDPNAFWQNYQKASQWANSQEIAYWRSRADALEMENRMLREQIKRLSVNEKGNFMHGTAVPVSVHHQSFSSDYHNSNIVKRQGKKKQKKKSKKRRQEEPVDDVNDSQLEFEVTAEMKDFFELHMRHKMEQEKKNTEDQKKSEEAANAAGEENAKLISRPINFGARADELKLLYGDASPTIHGMETAIQLSFRRHCEKTGARLWPNIPLKL